MRLEHSPGDDQSIAVSSGAARRRFDIHHLRCEAPGAWRSVQIRNVLVANDRLRVLAPTASGGVEISGTARREVDVEFNRYDGFDVARCNLTRQRAPGWAGAASGAPLIGSRCRV